MKSFFGFRTSSQSPISTKRSSSSPEIAQNKKLKIAGTPSVSPINSKSVSPLEPVSEGQENIEESECSVEIIPLKMEPTVNESTVISEAAPM